MHRAPHKHTFCPCTRPRYMGLSQKVITFFFLKVIKLHIKLKGMEHRAPCKHIFCPYTHPRPLGLGQNFFLKFVVMNIKLKRMELRASCKHIFDPNTHLWPLECGQNIFSESLCPDKQCGKDDSQSIIADMH